MTTTKTRHHYAKIVFEALTSSGIEEVDCDANGNPYINLDDEGRLPDSLFIDAYDRGANMGRVILKREFA